jgi:hypothetical protein
VSNVKGVIFILYPTRSCPLLKRGALAPLKHPVKPLSIYPFGRLRTGFTKGRRSIQDRLLFLYKIVPESNVIFFAGTGGAVLNYNHPPS